MTCDELFDVHMPTLTVLSKYSQYNLPAHASKSLASELGADSETLHALR